MFAQRITRLTMAILASAASLALSWPYWRDFEYWAESRAMWTLYFVVGFVLAVYVFLVFFNCVATLFEHDAVMREADAAAKNPAAGERGNAS